MATKENVVPAGEQYPDAQKAKTEAAPAKPTEQTGEPKLSNKELKAKKQAEKAARRAQVKENKATPVPAGPAGNQTQGGTSSGADNRPGKGRGKEGPSSSAGLSTPRPGTARIASTSASIPKETRPTIPEPFSHIPIAKRITLSEADKDVHPAVLAVGQQMSTFTLSDSIARLEATLLAFKKVIDSYDTPRGSSFSRHFVPHVLNPQIEYLTECRPMCFAMGNAIRLLKAEVTKLDIDTADIEAKKGLYEAVDSFIRERITFADFVIARHAANSIKDGDVLLTYAHHKLVEHAITRARESGKSFEVIIIDDPYDATGKLLAKSLRREGTKVSYSPHFGGLSLHMQRATKIFLGAESMFANGSMYARAGTCDIAIAAKDMDIPVTALCETINFDKERISVDSLTYNEIDPERCTSESFRLLFDTTRPEYISVVVTELETGNAPSMSVLTILRRQEDPS